jgi:hypothetical protein
MVDESLFGKVKELQKKANMYDNVRGRYVEHAKKIKQVVEILAGVMKELDPVIGMKESSKSGINYKEVIAELFGKIKAGASINSTLIEATYDTTPAQALYIHNKLGKIKGVERRRDGKKVFLYITKEG